MILISYQEIQSLGQTYHSMNKYSSMNLRTDPRCPPPPPPPPKPYLPPPPPTEPPCRPGSTEPRCPPNCFPGNRDPRCPPPPPPPTTTTRRPLPPTTYLPPVTVRINNEYLPPVTTTTPRPTPPPCRPGSTEPRCPPNCFPGNRDPRCPPPPPPPTTTTRRPLPPSTYLPPVTVRTTTPAPTYLPPVEINLKKVDKENNYEFEYKLPDVTTRVIPTTRRVITTTTTTTAKPNRDYLPPEEPNVDGLLLEAEFQKKQEEGEKLDSDFVDPFDDPTKWNLRDSIPGEPGQDYPTLREIPVTDFTCEGRVDGYYADVQTGCQVFHVCSSLAPKSSFLCNNGSLFNQERFTCDWWNKVDCPNSEVNFVKNNDIGKMGVPMPTKENLDIDVRSVINTEGLLLESPKRRSQQRVVKTSKASNAAGDVVVIGSGKRQQSANLVAQDSQAQQAGLLVSSGNRQQSANLVAQDSQAQQAGLLISSGNRQQSASLVAQDSQAQQTGNLLVSESLSQQQDQSGNALNQAQQSGFFKKTVVTEQGFNTDVINKQLVEETSAPDQYKTELETKTELRPVTRQRVVEEQVLVPHKVTIEKQVVFSPKTNSRRVVSEQIIKVTPQPPSSSVSEEFISSSSSSSSSENVVAIPNKASRRVKVVKQIVRQQAQQVQPEVEVRQALDEQVPEQFVEAAFGDRIKKRKASKDLLDQ